MAMTVESLEKYVNTHIEATYMTRKRKNTYIACEDMDFTWDERKVMDVIAMWNMGIPINLMARSFGRDQDEVAVLIMDLRRKRKIKDRRGGIFGKAWGRLDA